MLKEETDRDSKKYVNKTARKLCEQIYFLKILSYNWAALLVLVTHASHYLILTSGVFVGSAEVMKRANAGATVYVIVVLVGSAANSKTHWKFEHFY